MSSDAPREIAARKNILDTKKQRLVWARLSTLKLLLIQKGIITHEEFETMVNAMVRDIDNKVYQGVLKDLGLDGHEGETVEEEADRETDCKP